MFQPAGDLAGRGERVVPGGGGYPVGASVAGGVVWFGGDDEIDCADPATGHIRATGTSSGYAKGINDSALAPVIAVGHDLFASYAGGGNVNPILVRLHPPASCRR
jgi:hypothetical protein